MGSSLRKSEAQLKDLRQFFAYLNDISFVYVVLRNWDNLPDNVEIGGHGDLDLLVYDLDHFKEIFPQIEAEFPVPRVRYKLPVGNTHIYMDLRSVGDGYYPVDFARAILETKEYNEKGFYTPNPVHFRLGLAYHCVHHKNFNTYERFLGTAKIPELLAALKESHIGYDVPQDPSVGRFNAYYKGATSVVEKKGGAVVKRQVAYKDYNLMANEARILTRINEGMFPARFPKVLSQAEDMIEIEDCGDSLTADNLPIDWKSQLIRILLELKANNIQHRDIKPDNLMVKDGLIKLIDFGWARFIDDPVDNPPACLGYPYRPSWGPDDEFAMKKIIKQFEYQKEERLASIGN